MFGRLPQNAPEYLTHWNVLFTLAVGVPLGVFGRGHIPNDILIWLVMLVVVPFAGWGFLTIHDLRFEDYDRIFLRFVFLPQKRVYEDTETNLFVNLKEEILEETIITQRLEAGEYERTGRLCVAIQKKD